jgi:hypothetical protein
MKNTSTLTQSLGFLACITLANSAHGQLTGPSTGSTPYILPTLPGYETTSILTVDNTGANPDDSVGGYGMVGIPDGLGAFDNGDGTFTLLMNHELGNGVGIDRAHGAKGTFVSKWNINKDTLAVQAGSDLITGIYGWNTATQSSNPTAAPVALNRFCSGDLPASSAFFNAATSLGTQARIYMNGEEGATGYAQGTVVTGPDAGKSYTLGKFNLTTNGSGLTAVGAWENLLASPFPQDKTIVIGNNDGGTGIMTNAVSVYVGTKQSSGTEVEKAGLMNGTLRQISVTANPTEITNTTTRTTGITSGTRFTLSATASTTFSRPEDGAWDPSNRNRYYFVTTDQLDLASDGLGAQVGNTRLWRLTFDDITNPDLGGSIDLLIDGRTVAGEKVVMFDNICINAKTGHIIIEEDVGGAAHNGKVWDYDPATDVLKKILKHDPARFGDRVGGVTTPATLPFNNDEEGSGIIDITAIMSGGLKHTGITNEGWYISSDQAHYTSSITASQAEGGQMLVVHDISSSAANVAITRGGAVRDRLTGKFAQKVTITNNNAATINGPFFLTVDALGANAMLSNPNGTTTVNAPLNSPYITIPGSSLAPGASATVTLQFTNPTNAAINYTTRVINGVVAP